MIIQINKPEFRMFAMDDRFELPIRWDGSDFRHNLWRLFSEYEKQFLSIITGYEYRRLEEVTSGILKALDEYFLGLPHKAFEIFSVVMDLLYADPFQIYRKSVVDESFFGKDPLKLFRVRNVTQNKIYTRKNIFHTPLELRHKVSSCRYSILGYPCLYLSTNLNLCCEEVKANPHNEVTIASRFELQRNKLTNGEIEIDVVELGIKPKDFLEETNRNIINENNNIYHRRIFDEVLLDSYTVMGKYLMWYPLIAACSYIRANRADPFAAEYIIPQLLMQWIRTKTKSKKVVGIRYFSCASVKMSEMGFNYVFPVYSTSSTSKGGYCRALSSILYLTSPKFTNEYKSLTECESYLCMDTQLKNIHEL